MVAISNEALEWLDRAEQAREVAGLLTDPGASKAVLQVADTFDRLAQAAVARTAARKRALPCGRARRGYSDHVSEADPANGAASMRSSFLTRRWRGESAANPSLKPKFPA